MTEHEWVKLMCTLVGAEIRSSQPSCYLEVNRKIPYGYEIRSYDDAGPQPSVNQYETDLVVIERADDGAWKPRVIIEAKLRSITTHDAITYSQKALSHKTVHPYLRYGIMLGHRKHYPLPGRLYRHGAYFDFMISFVEENPTDQELSSFVSVIEEEIEASR